MRKALRTKREIDMSKRCPCCDEEVNEEHFACVSGAKGGAAGVGESKARTSEQARAAALIRWGKGDRMRGGLKDVKGVK